ncbi:MAG: hypothetical protein HFE81_03740 [Bacilli bacterium]|nr:hypothetical protein [Bacilli bacterium]
MKKMVFGALCLIVVVMSFFLIKIPTYVELNNLIIVEGIGVECNHNNYKLYLKEVIPTKDDTGITYKYRVYDSDDFNSIDKSYKKMENNSQKKIFYKDAKYVITNCTKSQEIIDYFKIDPNYIEHTKNDIETEIKKK